MALKMNNVYCGDGFPNLPNFKDLSGGGSGSAAVAAGQAIRISDISVSNVSYKRVSANVDDLTIAVDNVTNKLKSLVKLVPFESNTEVDTGLVTADNKKIYMISHHGTLSAQNEDQEFDILPANANIEDYDCIVREFNNGNVVTVVKPSYYIGTTDYITSFIYGGKFHINHRESSGGWDALIKLFYTKNS